MYNSIDIAKWFIDNNLDNPRREFKGSMKLQKLIFFSQLIHIARCGKYLINEEFYAFENGMVVETVRNAYKSNLDEIINQESAKFNDDVIETLELTKEIYGDADADELSSMSHQFDYWRKYFNNSKTIGGYKIKSKSKVPNKELAKEIQVIKDVLEVNQIMKQQNNNIEIDY